MEISPGLAKFKMGDSLCLVYGKTILTVKADTTGGFQVTPVRITKTSNIFKLQGEVK